MATSGPLADFARLPTQRKILVFVVIGMLVGLLYWQFFYKGLAKDLEEAQTDNNAKTGVLARTNANIPLYTKLKEHFVELQRIVHENQQALPTASELPAFFETLNRKVKDAGVEIANWTQLDEEPVDAFVKVPVKVEITGSFLEIERFFASLVQKKDDPNADPNAKKDRERIVSIESLALGDAKLKDHELVLTAKFTAVTFRQDELKQIVPKGNAAAAAAAAAAAQQQQAAEPPLPPSSNPTGAKLRVEDAMKKDQERTDKGVGSALGSAAVPTPPPAAGSARLKGGN